MKTSYSTRVSDRSRLLRAVEIGQLLAGTVCILAASPAFGQVLGQNIIVNGDGESGNVSPDGGDTLTTIVGWTTTDRFSLVPYGTDNWVASTDPGPVNRGNNLFVGGRPSELSTATQMVDVSSWAATINGAGVSYHFSAWLGGWAYQEDNAILQAQFMGASGFISGVSLGPVTAEDRANTTGLLYRETSGLIPNGTESIEFVLTMTRVEGTDNDGYADNLSFVGTAVPETESYAVMAGACALGFAIWRKRRIVTPSLKRA